MLTRVLAEDLMLGLPGTTVFTETGALRGEAGLILETEIQRFEAGPAHAGSTARMAPPGLIDCRSSI